MSQTHPEKNGYLEKRNCYGACDFLYNKMNNLRDQCETALLRSSKTVIIPPLFVVGHICFESKEWIWEYLDWVVNIS